LGTLAGAALDGGMMSAAINVGVQLATTGQINWNSVGTSFASGALSAGMSFGVGEIGDALNAMGGNDLLAKTLMHGVSGGLQSMAGGGSFGSGFVGGAMGNLSGTFGGSDLVSRTAWGALGGGAGAWASGGDFWQGAQAGAYNQIYNAGMHELKKGAGYVMDGMTVGVSGLDRFLGDKGVSFGVTLDWFGVNGSVGIGQGPWFQKSIQTPNLGIGFYGSYNPGNAKNLGVFGLGRSAGVGLYANDKLKPVGGYMSVGVGVPIPFTGYRSF